jgi:hypothetical protein
MTDQGRICAIHQPNLFPRMRTLGKLFSASKWVVLTHVQANLRDFQQRALFADYRDVESQQWFSLRLDRPSLGRSTQIWELTLSSPKDSATALLESLRHRYRRSPYWRELWPSLESGIEELSLQGSLEGFSTASTEYLLRLARWDGSIVRDHLIETRQERTQRLVDLCAGVGATTYLCGRGGARYLDESEFISSGLEVRYYSYPSDATDRLSSLDYLFRNGVERFREVLSAASRLTETRP